MNFKVKEETKELNRKINNEFGAWLENMFELKTEDRETHINFAPSASFVELYSDDPIVCRRILKNGYRPINSINEEVGMKFHIPIRNALKPTIKGSK